jgi:hypothetical protein
MKVKFPHLSEDIEEYTEAFRIFLAPADIQMGRWSR